MFFFNLPILKRYVTLVTGFHKKSIKMIREKVVPNIKYRLTVGNISSVIAAIIAIYYFVDPGEEGWGIFFAVILIMFGLFMLIFDFMIQRFRIKYAIVNAIEFTILILYILLIK